MLLNQRVTFKAPMRKRSRLQVPKIIREQFKLETTQNLKVTLTVCGAVGAKEIFLSKIRKDGSITVPLLTVAILKGAEPSLENHALEVTLEPA
jgi:hypothetical protein